MKRFACELLLICCVFYVWGAGSYHGSVNKRISWELRDSVLYVTGTGAMPSYTSTSVRQIPWTDEKIAREIVSIEIGEGITEIGNYAFGFLAEVREVRAESERYTDASERATVKYYKLRSVSLPATLTRIGRNAFSKTPVEAIRIPEGVTEIGFGAFSNTALRAVKLPAGLKKLGAEAFSGCNNLQCADLNNASIGLGAGLFFDCDKLRMLLHTQNVKSVQPSTFNATIFAQFPEEELLNMFHSDGLEQYIAMNQQENLPDNATEEQQRAVRQALIDVFFVREAKNATVMFNLDLITPEYYNEATGTLTLETVNHGKILLTLQPDEAARVIKNWPDLRELLQPTFHPRDGRVELQFVSLPLEENTIIGSLIP